MTIKNKIGFCNNKDLGIKKAGGHYVYINSVNKNGTCNVNVITSLEDKDKKFNLKKLRHVKYMIKDIGKKKIKKRHFFFIGKFLK